MTIKKPFLYIIIDGRRGILEKLKGIVKAGVNVVQLRDKKLSTRELVDLAHSAKKVIRDRAFFFVNDRFDISMAVSAQGVHLGQDDLPVETVRKIAGKKLLIGFSTHTIREVKGSISKPVDYISFGPIFKTRTKLDALSPRGVDNLKKAVLFSRHPVVAIGGINRNNIGEVLKTGVSGVAISSGVLDTRDTYKVTANIKNQILKN